jgi:hydroxymethylpyrimidine pyrophosphatase-like HAD family hydrolase
MSTPKQLPAAIEIFRPGVLIDDAGVLWKFLVASEDSAALEHFEQVIRECPELSCVRSAGNRLDISRAGISKGHRLAEFIAEFRTIAACAGSFMSSAGRTCSTPASTWPNMP